jgi:hypothetical protein
MCALLEQAMSCNPIGIQPKMWLLGIQTTRLRQRRKKNDIEQQWNLLLDILNMAQQDSRYGPHTELPGASDGRD